MCFHVTARALCVPPSYCFQSGIRLFYVARNWQRRSHLVAVRQFNPTPEMLKSNHLSGLLEKYLKSVLGEYDLDVSMIFSATSDASSDVKRLCSTLLPGLWEWCACHMLNCALVEVGCWAAYRARPFDFLLQVKCWLNVRVGRVIWVLDLTCFPSFVPRGHRLRPRTEKTLVVEGKGTTLKSCSITCL